MAARRRTLLAHEEALAQSIAERVVELIAARGILPGGIPLGLRKEATWPSDEKTIGSSDPIEMESGGSSSWSEVEAERLLAGMRRKKKRTK